MSVKDEITSGKVREGLLWYLECPAVELSLVEIHLRLSPIIKIMVCRLTQEVNNELQLEIKHRITLRYGTMTLLFSFCLDATANNSRHS